MSRIESMFSRLNQKGEAALIPFITAGDPDLDTTAELILEMDKQGADLIELGVPFSDPLADGPTIQAASQRSLEKGTNIDQILDLVNALRQKTQVPLVLMGYFNPILQYGLERFAKRASEAGVDGTIVPDLPLEEAGEWMRVANSHNIDNIFLVAPNTPEDRIKRIGKATRGFLYYVSVTGITGARSQLPPELKEGLDKVKDLVKCPVAVGFGISRPEQVEMLSRSAHGIIVGSAIVKIIEKNTSCDKSGKTKAGPNLVKEVGEFVGSLKAACR